MNINSSTGDGIMKNTFKTAFKLIAWIAAIGNILGGSAMVVFAAGFIVFGALYRNADLWQEYLFRLNGSLMSWSNGSIACNREICFFGEVGVNYGRYLMSAGWMTIICLILSVVFFAMAHTAVKKS